MNLGLKDKVALLGGASKGLGRATAELLAREGCRVAVVANEPERGRVLVNPSRAAAVAFCKTLADDVARDGVTVNTVGTGWFDTARMMHRYKLEAEALGVTFEHFVSEMAEKFPAKRFG